MGAKSNRLRFSEVRRAMRLVGECRDLGDDPAAWVAHAAGGLQGLIGTQIALSGLTPAPFIYFRTLPVMHEIGWDGAAQRQVWLDYAARESHLRDPTFVRFQALGGRAKTVRSLDLLTDPTDVSKTLPHLLGLGDHLFSERTGLPAGQGYGLCAARARGDRDFRPREVRLLALYHDELARLIGTVLADERVDPAAGLPPRLRQTLDGLLAGDSAKQVAARLDLSPRTVEGYVKAVYRHFGASSRGELLARFVRRRGRADGAKGDRASEGGAAPGPQ